MTGWWSSPRRQSSEQAVLMSSWERFAAARAAHLAALAVVIQDSVQRRDTHWPAFHGSYDWHSAVHAVYALHVIHRLSGDKESLRIAESVLTEEAIGAELAILQSGGPPGECPYGYAWLLLLATERAAATGRRELDLLGAEAARRLAAWLMGLTASEWIAAMRADDYGNLSWAVLCLWRWAQQNADAAVAETAVGCARRLMDHDALLPLRHDTEKAEDFFPPALHRVLAILTVLPAEITAPWLANFLPMELPLSPIRHPTSAHQSGLNFSRAWGLWALWQATGEPRWRALYVTHIETHMAQPQYWAENHVWFSHWVPQFGVHAIAMSMA